MTPEEKKAACELMSTTMQAHVPHNLALGLRVVDYGPHEAWMLLPYAPHLVGNPATGILHGGAISTLMDAASGLAIFLRLGRPSGIATLDLRIDWMKPAEAGRDVIAHTDCYAVTRSVCFVRGTAYIDDETRPIATLAGTFARKAKRK